MSTHTSRIIGTAILSVTLTLLVVFVVTRTIHASPQYANVMMVTVIDEQTDTVEVTTATGITYAFYGADDWTVGDLVGCDVYTEDGEKLGVLKDILKTGANGVYVVEVPGEKDVLLPAVDEFILAKDIEAKRITVRVLREI